MLSIWTIYQSINISAINTPLKPAGQSEIANLRQRHVNISVVFARWQHRIRFGGAFTYLAMLNNP